MASTKRCLESALTAMATLHPYIRISTDYLRDFLAVCLIVAQPEEVFEVHPDPNGSLRDAAVKVDTQFQRMLDAVIGTDAPETKHARFLEAARQFNANVSDFRAKFRAWDGHCFLVYVHHIKGTLHGLLGSIQELGVEHEREPMMTYILQISVQTRAVYLNYGGQTRAQAYDAVAERVLKERRQLILLRQEQTRTGELFDFV
jgi:hypothetical protein